MTFSNCKELKLRLGQVEVGSKIAQKIARFEYLAYRKSYLAIIGPISHEKLTKYEIRSGYYLL